MNRVRQTDRVETRAKVGGNRRDHRNPGRGPASAGQPPRKSRATAPGFVRESMVQFRLQWGANVLSVVVGMVNIGAVAPECAASAEEIAAECESSTADVVRVCRELVGSHFAVIEQRTEEQPGVWLGRFFLTTDAEEISAAAELCRDAVVKYGDRAKELDSLAASLRAA